MSAIELNNNEETSLFGGDYIIKTSGALDLQWDINNSGFSLFTGSAFDSAKDVILTLPPCKIKVVNAGGNTAVIVNIRKQ